MHHSDVIACPAKVGSVEQVSAAGQCRDKVIGNISIHFAAECILALQPCFIHLQCCGLPGNQPVKQLNCGFRLQAGKENSAFGLASRPFGHGVDMRG
jgi:hypothetical protein